MPRGTPSFQLLTKRMEEGENGLSIETRRFLVSPSSLFSPSSSSFNPLLL